MSSFSLMAQRGWKKWLPEWLFLPGFRMRWARILHLDDLLSFETGLGRYRKGTVLDVTLPKHKALVKTLEIPIASNATYEKAIDLQIKQSMPNAGKGLVWRYRKTVTRNGKQLFEVVLLKGRQLQAIEQELTRSGLQCRTISCVSDDSRFAPFLDRRNTLDRPIRVWIYATVLLTIGVAAYIGYQFRSQHEAQERTLLALQETKAGLTEEVLALRQEAQVNEANAIEISNDLNLLLRDASRLSLLIDLTKALDDDTWISEVSLDGAEMRLSGFTGAEMTNVVSSIRALAWASQVELDGSISFDSYTRRNRFSLRVRMLEQ